MDEPTGQPLRWETFLRELQAELSNPVHVRLVTAYQPNDPVGSMEAELGQILLEVLGNAD